MPIPNDFDLKMTPAKFQVLEINNTIFNKLVNYLWIEGNTMGSGQREERLICSN